MSPRLRLALAVTTGVILFVAGLVFAMVNRSDYWVAYAPLVDATFTGTAVFLSRSAVVGYLTAAAGLMLISGTIGFVVGSRRRPEPGPMQSA
ncbi:MAG: hypothetical protein H7269_14145 [Cellulomonas sp.]|nr:hypothetical protein [Cellulomonas sp.]